MLLNISTTEFLLSMSCQFRTEQNIIGNHYKMNSISTILYHLISLRCCNISISLKIINLLYKKLRGYQRLGHFSIFVWILYKGPNSPILGQFVLLLREIRELPQCDRNYFATSKQLNVMINGSKCIC